LARKLVNLCLGREPKARIATIGAYSINGYWWLLVPILSIAIGAYFINGYWCLFYQWLWVLISAYYINYYWWLIY